MNAHGGLTRHDVERHAKLGIPEEFLYRAGVWRVSDRDGRDLLSANGQTGDFSGIAYPYVSPVTGQRVTARLRLDRPAMKADGTPEAKYRSPYGDHRHLFFPPGSAQFLKDAAVPATIVESEKAALAIAAAAEKDGRPLLVIATGGCWNFRGRIGKTENANGDRVDVTGLLPDFHLVEWTGRKAIVLFDAKPNSSVNSARRRLSRELRQLGGDVRQGHLPNDDARVNGPDDFIGIHGASALWPLLDRAATEEFRRTKTGTIVRGDIDNIRLALARLDVSVVFNDFTRQVELDGSKLEDITLKRLWVRINDECGFTPPMGTLETVLLDQAHASTVHPVREYLNRLVWDGVPRVDDFLVRYAGARPSPYVSAVSALPLMAAVRRVRKPGTKFDELLVLESPQGTLKSSGLRALCPNDDWFSDDLPLGVDSKHVIERTVGKWIVEAAEMHGNRGREAEQLKSFLSRQTDGPVRLAFGRLSTSVPRQFVMIGTTNALTAYLKDATGARRFWPVRVQRLDIAAIVRDRDQLWAEAAVREARGDSIGLPPELWADAGEEQELRRASDPWEYILDDSLNTEEDAIPVETIWTALGVNASFRDNRHADRVAAIMQRHGFTKKGKRRGIWHWLRDATGGSIRSEPSSDHRGDFAAESKRSNHSDHFEGEKV